VVGIVERVDQVTVKWVDVGEAGEGIDCSSDPLAECLGSVFDLARVD
jgi:hypothetical protein